MDDDLRLVTGAWLDAVGTIISALAEVRTSAGLNEINDLLVSIGEGLQAVGTLLIGTVTVDHPLNFSGNWIDGIGAATSAVGAYQQHLGTGDREENLRLEYLGDVLQSIGASLSSAADYMEGEFEYSLGNAIQGLGAGLEAIGGSYVLKDKEEEGQSIITIGAIIQAIGSNYNALIATREFQERQR